jgi:hypothetical protein
MNIKQIIVLTSAGATGPNDNVVFRSSGTVE